jgi:GTPase SAR1 family protein
MYLLTTIIPQSSLEAIREWGFEVQRGGMLRNGFLVLVGNKCDLDSAREVTQADVETCFQQLKKDKV